MFKTHVSQNPCAAGSVAAIEILVVKPIIVDRTSPQHIRHATDAKAAYARVGITIVDQDADLGGQLRMKSD